jgi:hypothetical protein
MVTWLCGYLFVVSMVALRALLHYYRFDCGELTIDGVLANWQDFDPHWVKLAIVEAIYRGRYKASSVSDILRFWQRRGEPHCSFSYEFERSICGDLRFALPPCPAFYPPDPTPFADRLRVLFALPYHGS